MVWFSFGDVAREGQEVSWGYQRSFPRQPGGEMSVPSSSLIQVGSGRSRAGTSPPPPHYPWEPRKGNPGAKVPPGQQGSAESLSRATNTGKKSHLQSGKLQILGVKRPGAQSHPWEKLKSGCPSSPGCAQHQLQAQFPNTGQARA